MGDAPGAGHLRSEKTLERLRKQAYWVGMALNVEQYFHVPKCKTSSLPQQYPLVNVPVGQPWQMVELPFAKVK